MPNNHTVPAMLILEDGTTFTGSAIGATGQAFGEAVFNTGMTGYQEVLTDPSYRGQIVVMTYPEIGIYGVNPEDVESQRVQVAGFVVHRAVRAPFNQRATLAFDEYLLQAGIVAIEGVDTRALTRHLRSHGAMRGAIVTADGVGDLPKVDVVLARVCETPTMAGRNLAQGATTDDVVAYAAAETAADAPHVVLIDAGRKENIVRSLQASGAAVTVVPCDLTAGALLALQPDGVMISNGPGDPEPLASTITLIRDLLTEGVPVGGICLGHQLLGIAAGGQTYKMRFGHRGANHPVRDMRTGRILITTQNHGFALDPTSLGIAWAPLDAAFAPVDPALVPDRAGLTDATMAEQLPPEPLVGASSAGFGPLEVTHLSLNDGTVEGLRFHDRPAVSVQYHPEAAPGPHDARRFFEDFLTLVKDQA